MTESDWERRVSDAWASLDERSEADFLALIERLAAELPPDSGIGTFDAVRAFLALAVVDTGREREAVSLALRALAPHLLRYQRSLANYAGLLIDARHRHG